jgi:hypothetical protein
MAQRLNQRSGRRDKDKNIGADRHSDCSDASILIVYAQVAPDEKESVHRHGGRIALTARGPVLGKRLAARSAASPTAGNWRVFPRVSGWVDGLSSERTSVLAAPAGRR